MQLRPSAMSGTPITDSHICSLTILVISFWDAQKPFRHSLFQVLDVTGKWSPLISQWEHGHHLISDTLFSPQYHFQHPAPILPKALSHARRAARQFLSHTGRWGLVLGLVFFFSAQVFPIPSPEVPGLYTTATYCNPYLRSEKHL